jgi:hypothetical protein
MYYLNWRPFASAARLFLLNVMGSNLSPLLMFVLVCCACKNFRCRQPKFVRQERFEYLMEQRDYRIKGLGWDGR